MLVYVRTAQASDLHKNNRTGISGAFDKMRIQPRKRWQNAILMRGCRAK
jgi:hypothetical protein